jgi:hypothetical protein
MDLTASTVDLAAVTVDLSSGGATEAFTRRLA